MFKSYSDQGWTTIVEAAYGLKVTMDLGLDVCSKSAEELVDNILNIGLAGEAAQDWSNGDKKPAPGAGDTFSPLELATPYYQQDATGKADFESFEGMCNRMEVLKEKIARYPEDRFIMVTHSAVIRHTFSGFVDGRKPENIAMFYGILNTNTKTWRDVQFLQENEEYITAGTGPYPKWEHHSEGGSVKKEARCLQDYKTAVFKAIVSKDASQNGDRGWFDTRNVSNFFGKLLGKHDRDFALVKSSLAVAGYAQPIHYIVWYKLGSMTTASPTPAADGSYTITGGKWLGWVQITRATTMKRNGLEAKFGEGGVLRLVATFKTPEELTAFETLFSQITTASPPPREH